LFLSVPLSAVEVCVAKSIFQSKSFLDGFLPAQEWQKDDFIFRDKEEADEISLWLGLVC